MWETLRREEVEKTLNTQIFVRDLTDDEVLKRQNAIWQK